MTNDPSIEAAAEAKETGAGYGGAAIDDAYKQRVAEVPYVSSSIKLEGEVALSSGESGSSDVGTSPPRRCSSQ